MKKNTWQQMIRKVKFIFLFALLFMQISCGGLSYMAKNYDEVSSEDLQGWMRKTEFIYLHFDKDLKEIELLDFNKEAGKFKFKIKGEIQPEQNYLYRHTLIGNNSTDGKRLSSLDQLHLYVQESKVIKDSILLLSNEDIEKATRLYRDSKSQYTNPNEKNYTNPVLDTLTIDAVKQERKSKEDYDKYKFVEMDYSKKRFFAGINFTNTFLINNNIRNVSYTKGKYSPGFQAYIGVKAGKSFTKFRFQIGYEIAFNRYFQNVYTQESIDFANNGGVYGYPNSIAVASNLHLGFFKIGLEAGKVHQLKADMGFGFGGVRMNINDVKSYLGEEDVAFTYDQWYQSSFNGYFFTLDTSITELSSFVFQFELSMGYSYNFNSGLYIDLSWILAVQTQSYGSNNYYSYSGYGYAPKLNTGVFVGIGYQFGKAVPSVKKKQRFNSLRYR